ncbi:MULTISPECIES: LPXTG cell wall anchor domain-containing protein [Atopobiaceae]|uniref:LPXTG-motif cell wall anchor domain-containing protein/Listeria/Bacterioides repeat-containing protein n=1 Tax=Parafannyhessea umbonata TaxID=604330 RepID=A0A1H9ND61_9ACTN|nr:MULTISPECIES: LPXTG cell wall anchor domain-containing protein [Atopobiaceae]SEH54811.1 LPXTG-motif cell wall anchor domain-containing protein/Listeria/Bacterioides repeat-containing protein [Parafannyhessea umbonata]SER33848.1 LPXTG-motif cell wall anchor domain-containing protein/Listeria/Bacterioides repeat-containing protein [Parafannyhessea umbonata]SJZ45551.1 LPXTG-motif cell wall anchor domain-containing protein/Listeria/Bacterioides repeat-containing protein [Olsenella sp. KH1P3]
MSATDSSYLIPKFDGQWYAVKDADGKMHLASDASDNSVYAVFYLGEQLLGAGELVFDENGKAKSIYIYGNTIPIPLDTLDDMVTVALCNDPSLGKADPIDMFMLEKTNAELVKDSYSNLGIDDVEVKLAISDMYDVQHEVKPELSFDPTGGRWDDGTDAVRKYEPALESEFAIIDAPTRDGYTFECWEGSEYQPGQQYHADSDHVFTAKWKKNDSSSGDDNTSGGAKNAQTKSSPSKTPSTGDLLNPALLLLAVLASGGTVAVAAKKRKREL